MTVSFFLGESKMQKIFAFAKDESGATAIEYGLIAALVGVAIIASAQALGTSLNDLFTAISGTLDGATS
jgi:pilus assembly protein Flp/PilA